MSIGQNQQQKSLGPQMKKIDAGYYFRNMEPQSVSNMIMNFQKELAEGRKRFKEILLRKYQNILSCEQNFNQMTSACGSLSENVESMHASLVEINTDQLTQIANLLNKVQEHDRIAAEESITYQSKKLINSTTERDPANASLSALDKIRQISQVC